MDGRNTPRVALQDADRVFAAERNPGNIQLKRESRRVRVLGENVQRIHAVERLLKLVLMVMVAQRDTLRGQPRPGTVVQLGITQHRVFCFARCPPQRHARRLQCFGFGNQCI